MTDTPKRGRGQPKLPPERRRISRGVSLPLGTWQALADLAAREGKSMNKTIQHLIEQAK